MRPPINPAKLSLEAIVELDNEQQHHGLEVHYAVAVPSDNPSSSFTTIDSKCHSLKIGPP